MVARMRYSKLKTGDYKIIKKHIIIIIKVISYTSIIIIMSDKSEREENSDQTEREEIKDETHHIEDEKQEEDDELEEEIYEGE
jgi:hypothetical protein